MGLAQIDSSASIISNRLARKYFQIATTHVLIPFSVYIYIKYNYNLVKSKVKAMFMKRMLQENKLLCAD
jgi:hypothetical protein